MHQAEGLFQELRYGFDLERLCLRLDPRGPAPELAAQVNGLALEVVHGAKTQVVELAVRPGALEPRLDGRPVGEGAFQEVITFAVRFDALGLKPGDRASFALRVLREGVEVERLPRSGTLRFVVPRSDFERQHWHV
jgi:hypothetical protein